MPQGTSQDDLLECPAVGYRLQVLALVPEMTSAVTGVVLRLYGKARGVAWRARDRRARLYEKTHSSVARRCQLGRPALDEGLRRGPPLSHRRRLVPPRRGHLAHA
eukprot:3516382-Alexandrium_andersonii.AAC.1